MEKLSFDDFKKLDIRIGTVLQAKRVEGSDKLLKLQVDFGEQKRQIVAGIGKQYEPEAMIGKQCPFAFNLETRIIKGLESQGMILCADDQGPVLLYPDKVISAGSAVK